MNQINFQKEAEKWLKTQSMTPGSERRVNDFAQHLAKKYPQEKVGKIEKLEIPTQSFQFYEVGLIFRILFDKINELIERFNEERLKR